jgi:hypothetical protein
MQASFYTNNNNNYTSCHCQGKKYSGSLWKIGFNKFRFFDISVPIRAVDYFRKKHHKALTESALQKT